MKKLLYSLFTTILVSGTALAQDLPKPSPAATVQQRIGLTDVTVTYSRPSAKGRNVWGDLVPYNELWRAGANKATLFSVSQDIMINGQPLPKGDYSLFILPQADSEWTLVFNKETELWGTGDYVQEQDAARIPAGTINTQEKNESLEFRFVNVELSNAMLVMDWYGKRVEVMIEADPTPLALANIEKAIENSKKEDLWKVYRSAAGYARDINMTKEGLAWIAMSVELQENWYSLWLYGELLAKNKEYKKAVEMATKAIEVGKKADPNFSYEGRIQNDINAWSAK